MESVPSPISSLAEGVAVPIPTLPAASITKGVASVEASSSTRNEFPDPRLVMVKAVAVEVTGRLRSKSAELRLRVLAIVMGALRVVVANTGNTSSVVLPKKVTQREYQKLPMT